MGIPLLRPLRLRSLILKMSRLKLYEQNLRLQPRRVVRCGLARPRPLHHSDAKTFRRETENFCPCSVRATYTIVCKLTLRVRVNAASFRLSAAYACLI